MNGEDCFWGLVPESWRLSNGDVNIFCAALNQPTSSMKEFERTLDSGEISRSERFLLEADRSRFVVSRGILRRLLGLLSGTDPSKIRFRYSSHGKPSLDGSLSEKGIRFNMSHSNHLALYAFSIDREVGVDLEYIRPFEALKEFVDRFFSEKEKIFLKNLPLNDRTESFFKLWTRREALLKALGQGLTMAELFDPSGGEGERPGLVGIKGNNENHPYYYVQQLKPAPNYVGAIAVEESNPRVNCWRWIPDQ
jgi:4'-phosphopantetheinyl transferase